MILGEKNSPPKHAATSVPSYFTVAPLALSPATNVEPENHATFFRRMATDGDAWK